MVSKDEIIDGIMHTLEKALEKPIDFIDVYQIVMHYVSQEISPEVMNAWANSVQETFELADPESEKSVLLDKFRINLGNTQNQDLINTLR